MKIMPCPKNGPRNIDEFAYLGVVRPEPDAVDDASWARALSAPPNIAGVVREWWCHRPSGYVFLAERDTRTDEILRTYPPEEAQG